MNQPGDSRETATRASDGKPAAGRRPLFGVVALAAVLVLAACGWRPLYERPSADPASGGVGATLAQISIDPISTDSIPDPLTGSSDALYNSRAAQLLQNNLKNGLNPYGRPSSALYHLAIQLREQTQGAISLGNGQTTRENLIMTAKYQLNDAKGQPVLSDFAQSVTGYDVLREPFSDLSSRRDAQDRSVQELAQAIQSRLSVFLRK
jgi:hypothetical protein